MSANSDMTKLWQWLWGGKMDGLQKYFREKRSPAFDWQGGKWGNEAIKENSEVSDLNTMDKLVAP